MGALDWQPKRADGVRDDRIRCDDCKHLRWRNYTAKLPPLDEKADPRNAYRTEKQRRPYCAAGYVALPGRRLRCAGFEPSRS